MGADVGVAIKDGDTARMQAETFGNLKMMESLSAEDAEDVGCETGHPLVIGPQIRRDEVRRGWEHGVAGRGHGPVIHKCSARTTAKINPCARPALARGPAGRAHAKAWLDPTTMRATGALFGQNTP